MMLNSNSSKKKKSFLRKSLKSKSNKRILKKITKHQEKPQCFISQFQLHPSIKEQNKDINKNKMKASVNVKNMNISSFNINFDNEENFIKDSDINSTFVFTGNNESYIDNKKIIENYLKEPPIKHLFECKSISTISNKETNQIIVLKDNSFTLNSSGTSLTSKTNNTHKNKIKLNNNKKFMSILAKINSSNITTNNLKEDKRNFPNCGKNTSNVMIKRKKEKCEKYVKIKTKKNINKIIYYILFIFVNILVYVYSIIYLFEPSVVDLFYDNDHDNYVYTTSLLSQDRNITMNK